MKSDRVEFVFDAPIPRGTYFIAIYTRHGKDTGYAPTRICRQIKTLPPRPSVTRSPRESRMGSRRLGGAQTRTPLELMACALARRLRRARDRCGRGVRADMRPETRDLPG